MSLRTINTVEGLADSAAKPHRQSLPAHILEQLELAAVTQWLYAQDESIQPSRLLEIARQVTANIHAKYQRGDR